MNNLKRILSLALASVMLVGMMVVGASATDYVDDEKIVNKDAVETLGALGIMNGDERGFRPEDGLTRAEAAKMLAKIHNKGRDVTFGVKDTPTFTDIKGHWAEGNIEYAAAFGIANGKGNGIFDPQGSLTVVQLARMALNMMGYDEGKTGSDWELQTTVLADDLGLFDGLDSFVPTANVTRDEAAQILVNSINAPMANGNATARTIYTVTVTKADATAAQKTLNDMEFDSNTDAILVADAYGLQAGDYTIGRDTKMDSETLGTKYLSLQTNDSGVIASVKADSKGTYTVTMTNGTEYTKVVTDYSDLMGQKVNVLYKASNSVYGITAIGTVVYEGTVGEYAVAANDPDKTDIEGTIIVEFNNVSGTHGKISEKSLGAEQSLKVVKNGTKSYTAVTLPQEVAEVTGLTAKNATVSGVGTKEIDKEILLNGAVKGDTVIVTPAANTVSGKVELALAEIVEGVAADAYRTVGTANQVRINGEWVTVLNSGDFDTLKAMTKNATYDLVMINGYVAAQSLNTAAAEVSDLLVLTAKAEHPSSGLNSYYEARAYFVKDGSTAIIRLPSDDANDAGELYAYTEKDGIYTLTTPTAKALGYTAAIENTGVGTDNKIGTTLIDENAQVIVLLKNDKVEIVTGKAARAWDLSSAFGATNALAFTKAVNGVNYVQFAFLTDTSAESLPGAGASGKNHGYIVSTPFTSSKGVEYKLWNGTEEIDVVDKDEDADDLAKGDFIEYAIGDGIIKSTKLTGLTKDAVLGWNNADKVINLVVKGNKVIDDKTVYLFVDTESGKGSDGSLMVADPSATVEGKYVANVMVKEGTDNHIDVIIVDVQNDLGEDVGTAVTPPDDHSARTHHAAVAGTDCQHNGTIEYWQCNNCTNKYDAETGGNLVTDLDDNTPGPHSVTSWTAGTGTNTEGGENGHATDKHFGTCTVNGCGETVEEAHNFESSSCTKCGASE